MSTHNICFCGEMNKIQVFFVEKNASNLELYFKIFLPTDTTQQCQNHKVRILHCNRRSIAMFVIFLLKNCQKSDIFI